MSTLSKTKLAKVISLKVAHYFWKKLKGIYEENDRVYKLSKKLTRYHYESLRMQEDKDVRLELMKSKIKAMNISWKMMILLDRTLTRS